MNNSEITLTLRQQTIISAFSEQTDIKTAAEFLKMPYSTLARNVKELAKDGWLIEISQVASRKRKFVARTIPGLDSARQKYKFVWDDTLVDTTTLAVKLSQQTFPFSSELVLVIAKLWYNSYLKAQGRETIAAEAPEIRARLLETINLVKKQIKFAEMLLQDAPFWGNHEQVYKYIGESMNADGMAKNAEIYDLRYWRHGLSPLQAMPNSNI